MNRCYVALSDRVLIGAGSHWNERLGGHRIECVAADSRRPDQAFVGTAENGLQRTTDGGNRWGQCLVASGRVTSVTISPHDPDVIWAGTEPSAVYRSTDRGHTWTQREGLTDLESSSRWSFPPRPHTNHVRWIEVAPDDPEQLYIAIEAGAFVRSRDGGETWIDHPKGGRRDNHTLAVHPDAPDRVYTAAGDGYALSPDRGRSWTYPQDGLGHRYVWSLAVHPDDPDLVVVSAASGPYAAHSTSGTSYVYRWDGDQWRESMDGLPGPDGMVRAVLDTDESSVFALTNRGLFRSDDGTGWRSMGEWDEDYDQVPSGLAVV